MYDYDKNGMISKEDIRTMLSYVPMSSFVQNKVSAEGILTREGCGNEQFMDRV